MKKTKSFVFVHSMLLSFVLASCNISSAKEEARASIDNIVRFGAAIQQVRVVKLSELVDSIELVPLETSSKSLLREASWYTHTPPYICVSGNLFDYKGKHVHRIGRQGQGPCEEPYIPIDVLFNPTYNKFLTKGSKLILYNERGECTGTERRVKFIEKGKAEQSVDKRDLHDMAVAGEHFVFNDKNDSLVWINIALEDVRTKAIPKCGRYHIFCEDATRYARLFTRHNDSTLMYNKHTGEAVAVDGSGFVDDILFTGSYFPKWGVFDNCLMQVVWPFRLRAEIEEKQARGDKIHPRIVQLLEQVDDEDNPLLMVAHLKKVNTFVD